MFNTSPEIRPVRDLRNNYTEIAKIVENHQPVFITNNGRGTAVLLNIQDYAAYEDFLREKYLCDKLDEAEREVKKSDAVWHSFEDTVKEMREKLLGKL